MKKRNETIRMLVLSAMFAALCCVTTMLVRFPTVAGYTNIGEGMCLLAGLVLGPRSAFLSAWCLFPVPVRRFLLYRKPAEVRTSRQSAKRQSAFSWLHSPFLIFVYSENQRGFQGSMLCKRIFNGNSALRHIPNAAVEIGETVLPHD